ncbi:MAG: heme-binding protein [Hyphomicrobiaceae bacterium]|nr:heme-binding protein [Hyphomicrobiaceae bacterium]
MQLANAETIVKAARADARERNLKPLAIAVLDARGAVRCLINEDNTSLHRADVAIGKAYGAIALGVSSRALYERAEKQAYFVNACALITGGKLVPVPGGVLIRDGNGILLGAIGISGDTSENDEAACCAGIAAAGLVADTGA